MPPVMTHTALMSGALILTAIIAALLSSPHA